MNLTPQRLLTVAALLTSLWASAEETALYPTGPAQDSAYIRFVNAGTSTLGIAADGGQTLLELPANAPVSVFFPVQGGRDAKGTLIIDQLHKPMVVTIAAGEFVTVVVVPAPSTGLRQIVVREHAEDFNSLKASLAFTNADPSCVDSGLRPVGTPEKLFSHVPPDAVQRREINPVNLSVELVCAGHNVGPALDVGELKAGERYSVLLLPSAQGSHLVSVMDSIQP